MTHILIIPSWYPTNNNPLYGIFFKEQIQALKRANYNVGVIAPHLYSLRLFSKYLKELKQGVNFENDQGIPTYISIILGWFYKIPYGNSFLLINKGKKLFKEYIKNYGKPDLIHAHSALMGGILASQLKDIYQIPTIITEHFSAVAQNKIPVWQQKLISKAYSNANKRIVVSPKLGELLTQKYQNNYPNWQWIPNMIDQKFAQWKLSDIKKNNKEFIFLHIGSLSKIKRQEDLLLAFAKSFKHQKNVKLRIGGETLAGNHGISPQELINITKKLGIDNQVIFLGALTRQEVYEQMCQAHTFVLSSEYETFSIVLIEALSCGLPVISTACGGPECIVNENNGILVPVKNIEKLSLAMKKMKANIKSYNPLELHQYCVENFGEQKVIEQLKSVYNTLINN